MISAAVSTPYTTELRFLRRSQANNFSLEIAQLQRFLVIVQLLAPQSLFALHLSLLQNAPDLDPIPVPALFKFAKKVSHQERNHQRTSSTFPKTTCRPSSHAVLTVCRDNTSIAKSV